MGSALRRGKLTALNIYFLSGLFAHTGMKILGYSHAPLENEQLGRWDDDFLLDGVRIDSITVPDNPDHEAETHKGGKTAVHEIGHWSGLAHLWGTNGDSCDNEGDEVDDTPAQLKGPWGCDPNTIYDSCPDRPGTDST